MSRLLTGSLIAGLLAISCGDGAGDSTTTTSTGVGTSMPSTMTSVQATTSTPPIPVLSDLTGNWENERAVLRVNDAGDYVVLGPDADPDQPLTVGFVARDEVNVIFVSGVAGECPGQTGVYGAVVDDDTLTLTLVDDPCAARAAWFELPFAVEG
ncbi:MAG TPA: hypothetical protein VFV13_06135 [Acidimicrobiia bacterium]|nr:hypothetical protein [Acidimicrobiia bacterium]